MFIGTDHHSLDTKGRLILPARYREQLAGGAFIAKVLDGCLAIYTAEEFIRVAQDMKEKGRRGSPERKAVRSFAAGAADATPDRQGRITIPQHQREFAKLDRDVVITGVFDRIEIWDVERWRQMDEDGQRSLADGESGLDDLGV